MYLRISVDVSDVEPKVTISPAACQVVPDVSRSRSTSSTSSPRCARWYATEVPITPPPMTTTRARDGNCGLGTP